MPTLPHDFAGFLSANNPPVLVIGAGLSYGLVPLPAKLVADKVEAANRVILAEFDVEIENVDLDDPQALYLWADKVITSLGAIIPGEEKRVIARVLGLTTEPCWTAKIDIDLRGTTPRHRVIARLAKENMWRSIWSLNWDTVLESALEQVGFDRGHGPPNQCWPTFFATNLLSADLAVNSPNHIVDLCKPHGCVHSLIEAEELFDKGEEDRAKAICSRLMVGSAELSAVRDNETDNAFFCRFRDHVLRGPLVCVGWSVSEPSLLRAIDESVKPKANEGLPEQLTIIDLNLNDDGHEKLLSAYKLTECQVHCAVSTSPDELDTDNLFLWVQTRYALGKIHDIACDEWKPNVRVIIDSTDDGELTIFSLDFADNFLPAWVRLCWRAGIMQLPPNTDPESLDLERQDHHIPLRGPETVRDDLKSAANLIAQLSGHETRWNLSQFPGCLWCPETQGLIIPIPCWASPGQANDLRALKVMLKRLQRDVGLISWAAIYPMRRNPADTVDNDWVDGYKTVLASYFRTGKLSDSSEWEVVESLLSDVGRAA